MNVHEFHVVSEETGRGLEMDKDGKVTHDGYLTTVEDESGVKKGPFQTTREAIDCAHAWHADNETKVRAALQAVLDAAPTVPDANAGSIPVGTKSKSKKNDPTV